VMTDEEKRLTAYHEGGHALVALMTPASDPVHKATIIPRGRALGMVMRLPERDQYSMSRDQLEAHLTVAMAGRIAEELIFGDEKVTTGAAGDIRMATDMARRMVTEWGMSSKLGPLRYSENEEEIFLGHSVTQRKNVSESTAQVIDEEIRRIVEEAEAKARRILTDQLEQLHKVAKALLEYETLTGEEIKALLRGEQIYRPDESEPPPADSGSRSAVPPTRGKPARGAPGGLEPEPQPGG